MNIQEKIKNWVKETLGTEVDFVLEHPSDLKNGDYSTNVALTTKTPAKELVEKLEANRIKEVSKVEIAGPGFINFTLTPVAIATALREARTQDMWGANTLQTGRKIMVEYTDPNPFKEFHIGHLMSNATGESISRLLQFSGAEIKRACYQGDVGPHVAKAIWGVQKLELDPSDAARLGQAYAAGAQAYESDAAAKVEIDGINVRVYDKSDSSINNVYAKGREASLRHFEDLYQILGTTFDFYFFESETAPKGVALVRAHPEIFEESEGAVVFRGEQYGLHTRVFINKLGLPTYEAKDLGLAELKNEEVSLDQSITVTAQEQTDYFRVVKKAMELVMPEIGSTVLHISHGMMRFADGKMSSRTGNVITGESLITDLIEVAKTRATESRADDADVLAEQIAVAAIKYQILKQGSGKDIIFDRERALSLEGDSGPYLQYAYARTCAILMKAREQGVESTLDETIEPSELMRLLCRFPQVVEHAAAEYEPHLVAQFLLQIASGFNSWYAQELILDGTLAAAHKVAIVVVVNRTLKNGLWILGIPAPEKM